MYKMITLIIISLFITTACLSNNSNRITEKSKIDSFETYNEQDVLNRLDELKNGRTPEVKPTGSRTSETNQQAIDPAQSQGSSESSIGSEQVQIENLAIEYNQAILKTNLGDISLGFFAEEAPLTVNNFLNLAKKGFYDNTKFHRVMKDFMIQGGDPNSKDDDWSDDGQGGPGYRFQDEINSHKLVRGILAMANSGANTNGSQFFIVTAAETPWLDGKHTVFGYVVDGMDVVDKIEAVKVNGKSHPIEDVVIKSIELVRAEVGPEIPEDLQIEPALEEGEAEVGGDIVEPEEATATSSEMEEESD